MKHETKIKRAIRLGNWHRGPETSKAVIAQLPQSVLENCNSVVIAAVATAINNAYHAGRASTGAEMVDGNCVWINSLSRPIEWIMDGGKLTTKFAD